MEVAHERSFLQIREVKQSDDGTSMDTTSAAAAPAGEGSAFGAVHIKQEPGGQSDESPLSRGTEGDGPRTIRKITVLDPLKLKLLSRQNHNKLLSGLSAAKAKAQPPAPKPPPPPPPLAEVSPSSSGEAAAAEKETQSNVTAQSESEALRPKAVESTNKESATATTILTAPPKSGAGGGSSQFRRKKMAATLAKRPSSKLNRKMWWKLRITILLIVNLLLSVLRTIRLSNCFPL